MKRRNQVFLCVTALAIGYGTSELAQRFSSGSDAKGSFFSDSAGLARPGSAATAEPLVGDQSLRLTSAQAQAQREEHYAQIQSLDEVLSLPTDFAQTEALYVLAGRAEVAQLQNYIRQAQGIANPTDRKAVLQILYLRYTELDPIAALMFLDQNGTGSKDRLIETIFYSWTKVAPQQAVAAANRIQSTTHKEIAARAILRAYEEINPSSVRQIAAELDLRINLDQIEISALSRLAETDPAAALEALGKLENYSLQAQAAYAIGRVIAEQDPAASMRMIERYAKETYYRQLQEAVFQRWAETDPEASFGYASTLGDASLRSQLMTQAVIGLAQRDPRRAFDLAQDLDAQAKQASLASIFHIWSERDIRAALAASESISDWQTKQQVLPNLAYQFALQDPEGAFAWATESDSANLQNLKQTVLSAIARRDPQRAWDLANEQWKQNGGQDYRAMVLSVMAAAQPQLAASYIDEIPAGRQKRQAIMGLVQQWANQDANAAFNWVSGLDAQNYNDSIMILADAIGRNDPDLAASLAESVNPAQRGHWVAATARNLARSDPAAALSWVNQYRGESYHQQALAEVVRFAAMNDPQAGLAMLDQIDDPEVRGSIAPSLVSRWAQQEPYAALQWAQNIESPQYRRQAVTLALHNWAMQDGAAAQQWALSQPAGATRDQAISALVQRSDSITNTQGLNMIRQIESEQIRSEAVNNRFSMLMMRDPESARDFVDQAPVPDDYKKMLHQTLDQMQQRGVLRNEPMPFRGARPAFFPEPVLQPYGTVRVE